MDEMNQNLPEEMELVPQEEQSFFEETEVLAEETAVAEEAAEEEAVVEDAPEVVVEEVILPKRPFSPGAVRFITILLTLVVLAAGVFFNKDVFTQLFPSLDFLNSLPTVVLPDIQLPF